VSFVRFQDLDRAPLPVTDRTELVLEPERVAAWQEAEALLAAARAQAERIVGEAQAAFDAEKQRGYEEGLMEARLEEADRMIENATKTVEYFAAIEHKIVGLVMQAVRRIMADFTDTERVVAVVQSGLAVMRNQKQLTLRLAPEHLEGIKGRAAELLERFPGVGMIDFMPDPRLKGDAAILESEMGVVEASIELQLKAIEQSFAKLLGSRI
jgi:type III secretion protein L